MRGPGPYLQALSPLPCPRGLGSEGDEAPGAGRGRLHLQGREGRAGWLRTLSPGGGDSWAEKSELL